MRKTAVELGLACGVSAAPRTGAEIKSHAVPHTMSLAWYIGRAIHLARQRKTNYFEAIVSGVRLSPSYAKEFH